MFPNDPLVSICLPTRNGELRLSKILESIRAQDHTNFELIISDNASTDATEDLCREWARTDERIVYVRQAENVGLLNNFVSAMHRASGTYFRWVSDDDWLAPNSLSRCLREFEDDEELILVTMGIEYLADDGMIESAGYRGGALRSRDPLTRLGEILRLLNQSYLLVDPLYGLIRRGAVASLPRRNMLREDQIFAVKMALVGPWGHVSENLARRGWRDETRLELTRRLDVPRWTARAATTLQFVEMMRWLDQVELPPGERRRAKALVCRWYAARERRTAAGKVRGVARAVGVAGRQRASDGAR